MDSSTAETLALLQAAVADLRWVSETDAPLTVASWPPPVSSNPISPPIAPARSPDDLRSVVDHHAPTAAPTPKQLLGLLHKPADCPVEALTVEALFAYVTTPQSWHSTEAAATVQRYQALVQLLNTQLTDLRTFRVGSVNVEIYVIGQARTAPPASQLTGDWLSLTTQAVET